jgi:hypothetical protein
VFLQRELILPPHRHSSWNPVVSAGFWSIASDGISINGSLVEGTAFNGVIDSGTTYAPFFLPFISLWVCRIVPETED